MDQLAVRTGNATVFDGIEGLDIEIDRGRGVVDDEVRGYGGLNFDGPGDLLEIVDGPEWATRTDRSCGRISSR